MNPTIFGIGGFELRWYSLFFASGFLVGFFVVQQFFRAEGKPEKHLDYLLMFAVIGTLVGARLAHCLLYEPEVYLADPIRILMIREGGLASHGGFAGVMLALGYYTFKNRDVPFFWVCDRFTIPTMFEAGLIRMGNFFNSEILGHPTDLPWGITFTNVDSISRHPTALYEIFGYWSVSAITYWYYRKTKRKPLEGRIVGIALAIAFTWRIFVEFFKENQVPFEEGMIFNMGQLLSIPFIFLGIWLAMGGHHKVKALSWGLSPTEDPTPAAAASAGSRKKRRKRKKN